MIICLIINNYPVKQFAGELLVGTENIIIDTENTCRNISSNRTETNLSESDLIYLYVCSAVQFNIIIVPLIRTLSDTPVTPVCKFSVLMFQKQQDLLFARVVTQLGWITLNT